MLNSIASLINRIKKDIRGLDWRLENRGRTAIFGHITIWAFYYQSAIKVGLIFKFRWLYIGYKEIMVNRYNINLAYL